MVPLKCIHGLATEFCARCSGHRRGAAPRQAGRSRSRRAIGPGALDFTFASGGTKLTLLAQPRQRWRFLRKVYGFSEQVVVSSLVHSDVRAQVQLFPAGGGLVEDAPVLDDASGPPDERGLTWRGSELDGDDSGAHASVVPYRRRSPIQFTVKDGGITLEIEILGANGRFTPELNWGVTSTGAPYVKWAHDGLIGRVPNEGPGATWTSAGGGTSVDHVQPTTREVRCQLQLLLVARPPALRAGPVEREWLERHFVSGGLPTLGKRR